MNRNALFNFVAGSQTVGSHRTVFDFKKNIPDGSDKEDYTTQ